VEPVEGEPKKKAGAYNYWRQDDGGFCSATGDELYFMLIIDIFTTWNTKKKLENSLKSLIHESSALSAVEPSMYRDRFIKFISALVH
jgi:1-phosphatidylinositol-4-phosphate 5-kinase